MVPDEQYEWGTFDPRTDLELDPQNPRLPRQYRGASQTLLIELMVARFDVSSLAEAIVTAGYLEFDPIAGSRLDNGVIRIREGNRRVAAAKLLLQPEHTPSRFRQTWDSFAERLPPATRNQLENLNVQVWSDPEALELSAYIGYRHVTGVRPWPPVEKARYIAYLIESESLSYKQTADRIGSRPRHVERHFVAYKMVEQALALGLPGAEQMEDAFGVLLRSLQARGIPEFLGIDYSGTPSEALEPIPSDREQQFREFIRWTFGTPDQPKVLRDSRDITRWAKILSSRTALAYLRRTKEPDFERAWERSGGEAETLVDILLVAADNLREAVPIIGDHVHDADVRAAAVECGRFFARMMRQLPDLAIELKLATPDA